MMDKNEVVSEQEVLFEIEDGSVSSDSIESQDGQGSKTEVSAEEAEIALATKGKTRGKTAKNIERLLKQRNEQTHRAEEVEGELVELRKQIEAGDLPEFREMLAKKLTEQQMYLDDQQSEYKELLKEYPEADSYQDDLEKLRDEIPSLSQKNALRIAAPHLFVDGAALNQVNAQKTQASDRIPESLRAVTPVSRMSTGEMEKMLREGEFDGELEL